MKRKEKDLLRTKSTTSLGEELVKKEKELVSERMKKALGKGKNVKKTRGIRKEIAIIKTILREKELKAKE